ncbi:hypothetical protein [Streptomyces sp. NPDC059759]|uniref:hypothetical protein n=1 Tax=Streptomyces sp. NPDC059759 TaxID=3346936 RepID=UPI00364F2A15
MPESYPVPAGGQRLTGALLRSMQPLTLRKTADTARSATTTQTPDPHLQFTAEANAVYTWYGWIKYDGDTAADLVINFTPPAGALGEWAGHGTGITVIGATNTPTLESNTIRSNGYMLRTETNDVAQFRTYGCLGVGNPLSVYLYGILRVQATGGTWSLDWSQSASSATATTLYTDSYITLQRTA